MIIFVGDTPSPRMKPGTKAFRGAACEKRLYDWINCVMPLGQGSIVLGMSFKVHNQSEPYFLLLREYYKSEGYRFVALGNTASKALGSIPHFKLPHPSGRNRQLNNKRLVNKKLLECKEWLNEPPR